MLHLKEHSKSYDNTEYFKCLVTDYYPQRLQELETLHKNMMVMDEKARVSQLFLEKLINEINTLWRAEKHYWQMTEDRQMKLKFPKDYIVKKQNAIRDLISHLHSLLFTNNEQQDRKNLLGLQSDYIEIEYKLSGLMIEKERRIYEISAREAS